MVSREAIELELQKAGNTEIRSIRNSIETKKINIDYYERDIERCKREIERLKQTLQEYRRAKAICGKLNAVSTLFIQNINFIKNDIHNNELSIDSSEVNINYEKGELRRLEEKLKLAEYNKPTILKSEIDKIESEIKNIEDLKTVEKVDFDDEGFHIFTKQLIIHEPKYGKDFYLGKVSFTIPYNVNDLYKIKFYSPMANRVYGYSYNMIHPHIFENGGPCWGTTTNDLVFAIDNKSYLMIAILCLNFLQTVDIQDDAGRFVPSWGEVVKTEPVIEWKRVDSRLVYADWGSRNEILDINNDCSEDDFFCERCEEYYPFEETVICENCGERICENCAEFFEDYRGHSHVTCWACRDNAFYVCDCCDEWIPGDEALRDENENFICPDCADEYYEFDEETHRYIRKED